MPRANCSLNPDAAVLVEQGGGGRMEPCYKIDVNQLLEYIDTSGQSPAVAGPATASTSALPLPLHAAVPTAAAIAAVCWGTLLSGSDQGCGPGYRGGHRHFKNRFCARCQAQGVRVSASCVRLLAPGAAPDSFRKADTLSNRSAHGTWTATGFSSPEWFRVLNHTKGCTGPACVLFSEPIQTPPGNGALSEERLRAHGLYPVPATSSAGGEPTVLFGISRGTLVPASLPAALLVGRPEPLLPLLPPLRGGQAPTAISSASAMQSLAGSPDRDGGDAGHVGIIDPAALASVQNGVARFQAAAAALTASSGTERTEPSSQKRKRTWLQVRTPLINERHLRPCSEAR